MQKGTVLNLKQLNSSFLFLKNNWCLLLSTVMFIIGLSLGTALSHSNHRIINLMKFFMTDFLDVRINGSFGAVFSGSVFTAFVFLLLTFVFGTSVTGVTFVPIIVVIRGALFGSLVSLIYSEYALKGIAFNAIVLIPPTVISVIFLIMAARESIQLSLQITKLTLPETSPKNLSYIFNRYCKRYLILSIPTILSALLDAWLSIKLITYFNI